MAFENLQTLADRARERYATPKSELPTKIEKADAKRACVTCHKEYVSKWKQTKYCSLTCRNKNIRMRSAVVRICLFCKQDFLSRRRQYGPTRYCSTKCFYKNAKREAFKAVTCGHCGRAFTRRMRRRHQTRHFCNVVCRGRFFSGENASSYRGDSDPNRGYKWVALAEKIRIRDCYVCQRCGKSQQDNKQKLSVDHIRPWRSFDDKDAANDPGNLVSLCRACHSEKTHAAEAAWLRGDVLAMKQYERSVRLPPLFARIQQ